VHTPSFDDLMPPLCVIVVRKYIMVFGGGVVPSSEGLIRGCGVVVMCGVVGLWFIDCYFF